MLSGLNSESQLGADAIGRRHENRIGEPRRRQIKQAAEAAEIGVRAGARGGGGQRLDCPYEPVRRVDVDARLFIGQTVMMVVRLFGHECCPFESPAAT